MKRFGVVVKRFGVCMKRFGLVMKRGWLPGVFVMVVDGVRVGGAVVGESGGVGVGEAMGKDGGGGRYLGGGGVTIPPNNKKKTKHKTTKQ